MHPNNVKLLNNLGKLKESIGQHDEALLLYEQAIKVEPTDVRGWLNSANLNAKLENYQLAERLYRKAIDSFSGLYTSKSIRNKETPTASTASIGSVTPMQLRAAINLANLLSSNPLKKEEATLLYERLIALKPDFGATYFSWIQNLLANNSTDRGSVQNVLLRLISNAPQLDCDLLYNVS